MDRREPLNRGLNPCPLQCPACNQKKLNEVGTLPKMQGVFELQSPGKLYECDTCFLLFRHPYPSESEIEEAYSNFTSYVWSESLNRVDFDLTVDFINKTCQAGNIMDVGCYNGELLKRLSADYQKYGVELSMPARKAAQRHSIHLIGTSINHIEVNRPMFHAITLLDVIEHLHRPVDALRRVLKLLLPGGVVIISTGNTDFPLWKLMRRDYWYYFPEHVTFTNLRWFDWAAKQLDLDIVRFKRIPHTRGSAFRKWQQLINCLFYKFLQVIRSYPRFYNAIVYLYPFNRVKDWSFAPLADHLKDHMFIVLKSKKNS